MSVASRHSNSARAKVGVFIPCHNEADIIVETIQTVRRHLDSPGFPYEGVIIVVDDGSEDGSFELARSAGADYLYRHVTNLGLGAATRAGMEIAHLAGCDAFAKFDADLQHDIQDVGPSVRPLIDGEADVVYASRFAGKIHYKMPIVRYLGNRTFTWLMRTLTGWKITDAQTGLMCFSRRYLAIFEMPSTYNPPQQALFDASRKGMRYAEVPAQFFSRRTGQSFVSLRYIRKVVSSLVKLAFFHHSFRMCTYLGLGMLVIATLAMAKGFYGYWFLGAASYIPNSVLVVISASLGAISILLGLLSYAILGRQSTIRNSGNYRYIVIDEIVKGSAYVHNVYSPRSIDSRLES